MSIKQADIRRLLNDASKRIWKEVVVAHSTYCPGIFAGKPGENNEKLQSG
jgi:hypothetical protein